MTAVTLPTMPALARGYLAALASFARPAPDATTRLPETELVVERARVGFGRVARYNRACGFTEGRVPITFPFVFTFPAQLAALTRADSPLRVPGLVHLGIRMDYRRALAGGEVVRVACAVTEQATTARGLEFTLAVTVSDDGGAVAWHADSLILARGAKRARSRGPRPRHAPVAGPVLEAFAVPAHVGREYAQVSGDWNPIHLGRLGARAGGFDRPIAHGMWTLARTLAAVGADGPGRVAADFVAPLYLPASLEVRGDRTRVAAYDAGADRLVALAEMEDIP